jgi:acyl dehydratase
MNLDALIHRKFPPITQRYDAKDTILYALGVGVGADPVDPVQLPYVYERHLRILPSQSSVLAFPGMWLDDPALGVNFPKVLFGEQGVTFERPLKPTATIRGEYEVLGVEDKGPEKGAVVYFEKRIVDDADGGLICRVHSTYFLRADGGCGSWGKSLPALAALPERAPDKVIEIATISRQALIYRLNGDYNPIHAIPRRRRPPVSSGRSFTDCAASGSPASVWFASFATTIPIGSSHSSRDSASRSFRAKRSASNCSMKTTSGVSAPAWSSATKSYSTAESYAFGEPTPKLH